MCLVAGGALLTALGTAGAGAGAVTATGAAATIGSTLATAATVLTTVGSVVQGVSAYRTGKRNQRAAEQQAQQNALLKTQEDGRMRQRMRQEMARQNLQIADRGISPDSPTVQALGEAALEEMEFASGAIQSDAAATTAELRSEGRASRSAGGLALLGGGLSAATSVLTSRAKRWDRLYA